MRVNIAISDALVVRDNKPIFCGFDFFHVPNVDRFLHFKQLPRIMHKLLLDAERANNQHFPALVFVNQPAPFELLNCLAKSERFKKRAPAADYGPIYRVPLVRFQHVANLFAIDGNTAFRRNNHLRFQKIHVRFFHRKSSFPHTPNCLALGSVSIHRQNARHSGFL